MTGRRKILFAIGLTILACVFAYIKDVAFNDWATFIIWLYGTYAVGNVGEHFSKRSDISTKQK